MNGLLRFAIRNSRLATPDGTVNIINGILGAPEARLALATVRRRVNRMGIIVSAEAKEAATDLELHELSIGDGLRAVISLVRVARTEMPSKDERFKDAARHLA